MRKLFIDRLSDSSVLSIARLRSHIDLDPEFQRQGDVWPFERRRLLIDSILNGYDIPKFYFRNHVPPIGSAEKLVKYSVIDGKQRLQAIWAFLDDSLQLAESAQLVDDPDLPLAGLSFSGLDRVSPGLARRFLDYRLDVVLIETADENLDLVEDMFLRLNEAAPLNAAEKRNAYPGPMPRAVRSLAEDLYFKQRLPFANARYRHYDIAAKFLYFEYRDGVGDTKKVYLDKFFRDAAVGGMVDATALRESARGTLAILSSVFLPSDPLLSRIGMSSVYYLVARTLQARGLLGVFNRTRLEQFEAERESNRLRAESDEAGADYDLLEFDRYAQSPNDRVALEFRCTVLLSFLESYTP
ncbi:DUF262 domain-containing protein [Mycobacterium colombiense]|uniref:DUF262 domain-containing protein n=1 Tax=Mycobacterium colombiense TaxID=339268 RepID=UPI0009BC9A5A|nr:DUF262 domain-containing protein [Mycobacterium colombiense]